MAQFKVIGSDGIKYVLEGPADATPQELEEALNQQAFGHSGAAAATPAEPQQTQSDGVWGARLKAAAEAMPSTVAAITLGGRAAAAVPGGPYVKGAVGLGVGLGTALLSDEAKDYLIDKFPETAKALGVDKETRAKEQAKDPYGQTIAAAVPGFLAFTPEGLMKNAAGESANVFSRFLRSYKGEAGGNAAMNAGIQTAIGAGSQLWHNDGDLSKVDWSQVGLQAGLGALQTKPTKFGNYLTGHPEISAAATPAKTPVTPPPPGDEDVLPPNVFPPSQTPNEPPTNGPRRLRPDPNEMEQSAPPPGADRIAFYEDDMRQRSESRAADDAITMGNLATQVKKDIGPVDNLITKYQNMWQPIKRLFNQMSKHPDGPKTIISGPDANDLYPILANMDSVAEALANEHVADPAREYLGAINDLSQAKNLNSPRLAADILSEYLIAQHADARRTELFLRYRPLKNEPVVGAYGGPESMDEVIDGEKRGQPMPSPNDLRNTALRDAMKIASDPNLTTEDKIPLLKQLGDHLREIVYDPANVDPYGATKHPEYMNREPGQPMPTDWASAVYAPAENTDPTRMSVIRQLMDRDLADPTVGPVLERALTKHKELIQITKDLQRQGGKWNGTLDALTDGFYRWGDTYTPLKSRFGDQDPTNLAGTHSYGDVAGFTEGFGGGKHITENTALQTIYDAYNAAHTASREGVTLRVKNLIEQGYLPGEYLGDITAPDRFLATNAELKQEFPRLFGGDTIYHMGDDGTAHVYRIKDQAVLDGIRRPIEDPPSLALRALQSITGLVSNQLTRLRLTFAPWNFLKHSLMNAYILPNEYAGEISKFQYPIEVAKNMRHMASKNILGDMQRLSLLYRQGKFTEINRLAAENPFVKDAFEFLQYGGKAAYMHAMDVDKGYKYLETNFSNNKLVRGGSKALEALDKILDTWSDGWDFVSRGTAYSLAKPIEIKRQTDIALAQKHKAALEEAYKLKETTARIQGGTRDQMEERSQLTPEETADVISKVQLTPEELADVEDNAKRHAAFRAKELANFSLRGSKSRVLSSLYAFIRPAMTTAVKTAESFGTLRYLVPKYGEELLGKAIDNELLPQDRQNPRLREAAAQRLLTEAKRWQLVSKGLFAAGMASYVMSYHMSDEDAQGRNRIAAGKKDMWIRNINFAIPGSKKLFSLPVGFGPGGIVAMGAQTAAYMMGHQTTSEYLGNLGRIGAEMWSPIQPSMIKPADHPMQFIADTIAPTPVKAAFESAMNMNSMGNPIYNTRQSKIAESISGGGSVPQIYKDFSGWLYREHGWDIPPNLLYFEATNYMDGAADMATQAYELREGLANMFSGGQKGKSIDPKVFMGSFLRNDANYDSENYASVNQKIGELSQGVETGKLDPRVMERMYRDHPEAQAAIAAFRTNLHDINTIEHEIKLLRASPNLPTELKNQMIDFRTNQLNLQKRIAMYRAEPFGITP